jgi:hypothetical protein
MGTSNTLQTLWRKIPTGVKTQNPCTCHTWVHCPPLVHSAPTVVLTYVWGVAEGCPKKFKYGKKSMNGVTICDVVHKIYKILHTKVLGHRCFTTKCHQNISWDLHALLFDPDGSTSMVSARSITNFKILASHISRSSLSWRADPVTALGNRVWSKGHNRALGFGDSQRSFEAVNRVFWGVLRQSTRFFEVWPTFKWAQLTQQKIRKIQNMRTLSFYVT